MFCSYLLDENYKMDSFDLFVQLIHIVNNSGVSIHTDTYYQKPISIHQKESTTNFYIFNETVYSAENICPDKKKDYPIVRFINLNAKEYQKYRDVSQTTEVSDDRDGFLRKILHTFIEDVEDKFSSSNAIREVMMSATTSVLICVLLTKKTNYKFKVIGGLYYCCSPLFGVVVPLMIVNNDYHKKGLGKHFLRSIQKYTVLVLKNQRCLVWFTYDKTNTLLSFYRKLGFHPAISINLPIEHCLPLSLTSEINTIDTHEYLIECLESISLESKVHEIPNGSNNKRIERICEICGLKSKFVLVCQHNLKNSSYKFVSKGRTNKNKEICGLQICYSCNSQFGVSPIHDHCVFHAKENNSYKYKKPSNAIIELSSLYSKERKICRKIYDVYKDTIEMATKDKANFYRGYFESFDIKNAEKEIKCRHCFLSKNQVQYQCFQSLIPLQPQMQGNSKTWTHLKYVVNNHFELKNQHDMTNFKLHESRICPVSPNVKHNLTFDDNIGRPSTLLQNCILGIKNVYGFGDCGVLSLLLPILSADRDLQGTICINMQRVYKKYPNCKKKKWALNEIFTIKGIRSILFYAKINTRRVDEVYDLEDIEVLSEQYKDIQNLREDEGSDVEELTGAIENMREQFAMTYEDEVDHNDIYWLTDSDMLNLRSASNGMICVLGVTEFTFEIQNNQFRSIIHDFNYNFTFQKHILQNAKYFILLRHIDGQHYDYFYDRRNKCAIFEIDYEKEDSVLNYILQFCSPAQYFVLTGKEQENIVKFGDEEKSFYLERPTFSKWKETFETMSAKRKSYIELKEIKWIEDASNNLEGGGSRGNEGKPLPIIMFYDKFKENPSINLLLYVKADESGKKLTLYDRNCYKMDDIRIKVLCTKFEQDAIDLENFDLQAVAYKPKKEDILLCEQFITHQIFVLKVHDTGDFSNQFYNEHFGSSDPFRFRQDEEYLKQACLILSHKHNKIFIRKQLFSMYTMIRQQKKEQKLYFDYFYDFEMKGKADEFQKWFYRTNPEYSLTYEAEKDEMLYLQDAKAFDNKCLYYLHLDIHEIHKFWEKKFSINKKEKKERKMISCWESLQHSLDIKYPKTTKKLKKMKPPLNSVKLLSFFQHQDSLDHDKTDNDWTKKKIMGFYMMSGLMEYNKNETYTLATMNSYAFIEEDQNLLRDCLLFHCGYLKDEVTSLFNLTNIIPKHNLALKQKTNRIAKPKIPPKPSSKININKNEKSTTLLLSSKTNHNLDYAKYVIKNKDSSPHKIYKIEGDDKTLPILQLQHKCKEMGTLIHPQSKNNKHDVENQEIYKEAFHIALSAAQRMFAEKVSLRTEEEENGSVISAENNENGEELIIKMFHDKVDQSQQLEKSKTNKDSIVDEYFTKSLSLKMQFLSRIIKFENTDQQPFVYEDFDLKIHHKKLQATSIFLYDHVNLLQAPYQNEENNPSLKIDDYSTVMYHSDLWRLGKERWLNDNNIFGASRLFQKQFPDSEKIKIFEPQFYTLAKSTDYKRLSSIFFHTKMEERHQESTLKKQKKFFDQYEILLIPVNITNSHWYLIYMHLKENQVYIIDSISSRGNRKNEVLFLLGMLCQIVEQQNLSCDLFTSKHWSDNNTIKVPEFPQQNDGHNCGIFVLMTIYQVLRHKSLKKLFHPNNADKFRKYVYDLLVHEHFKSGGKDQNKKDIEKSLSVMDTDVSYEDEYVEVIEITNDVSQQYIANLLELETEDCNIADEIIQVPIELQNKMKSKYFQQIMELVNLSQLQTVQRRDIMEVQHSPGKDGYFIQFDTQNRSFLYPDFSNYYSSYTAATSLNQYYTKCLERRKKNEDTNKNSKHNIEPEQKPSENEKENVALDSAKTSNQAEPDQNTSTDEILNPPISDSLQDTKKDENAETSQIFEDKKGQIEPDQITSKEANPLRYPLLKLIANAKENESEESSLINEDDNDAVSSNVSVDTNPFSSSSTDETDSTISDEGTKPSSNSTTKIVLPSRKKLHQKLQTTTSKGSKNKHASKSKSYLPQKRPKRRPGKNLQSLAQKIDFNLDEFKANEDIEEPRESLMNILFDCSDLESNTNPQDLCFERLFDHYKKFNVAQSEIEQEVITFEEDQELREVFKDEEGHFSLSNTVDYFINQLRMKYLMSMEESKDDNEPGKEEKYMYFYVSRSKEVRRELIDWELYNPEVWCGINRTFAHKWMSQPFPTFKSTKKYKKFRNFNNVEKEAYQFIREWKKYHKKKRSKWLLFTAGMRMQYQALNRRDFRTIVETFCPVQKVKYLEAKDKYYGEYYFNEKKMFFFELDDEFFRKNQALITVKNTAKEKSGVSIDLEHGSSASSYISKTKEEAKKKGNTSCYPKIRYDQGKHQTCLERSMNSVLWFWMNNCTDNKPAREKERIKNKIGEVMNKIDFQTRDVFGSKKLRKVNTILQKDNLFSCEKFPKKQKKKRKRDKEDLNFNILSEDFDKGDFTLCQLCGSDGNKNHTITITKEWIFDTNFSHAMPLNEENLHKCCGQLFDTTEKKVSFEKCVLAYRYKYEVC